MTADAPEALRVFVADAQPLFRWGARLTLEAAASMSVVGDADTARDALQALETLTFDVCLIDAMLPLGGAALGFGDPAGPSGIELGRLVKHRWPGAGVVIIAAYDEEEQLFQAMKIGASAFCLRDIDPDDLVSVVRRVHEGEYLLSESVLERPRVTERVLKQFRELSSALVGMEPLFVPLSTRELEILDHIGRGYSNKAIARALSISDQTVKNHVTAVLRKLAVNDRTQAVIYALRHKWIAL
jgi:DNA-binding NarL/FixJ family response regulator